MYNLKKEVFLMSDKEKIDFEDLFKEENDDVVKQQELETKNLNNHHRSIIAIAIYLFVSIFVAAILLFVFDKSPYTKVIRTPDEIVLIELVNNTDLIAVIKKDEFSKYERYHTYLKKYDYDDDYYLVLNAGKIAGKTSITFFIEQEIEEIIQKNEFFLIEDSKLVKENLDLYFQNTIAEWKEKNPIKLLLTDEVKPDFIGDDLWDYNLEKKLVIVDFSEELSEFALSSINLILYIIMFAFLFLTMFDMIKHDVKNFINLKSKGWISVGVGLVIFYAFSIAASVVQSFVGLIFKIDPQTSVNQATIELALRSNGIYFTLISAILFGPIVEELVFRKSIFSMIKNKWVAIIVSSLLFGLIHVVSESSLNFGLFLYSLIPYLMMGVAFGWIYSNNQHNVMITTLVHMVYNLVATIMVFII
jgi:membrane protease YdiL (CAAX protease family)